MLISVIIPVYNVKDYLHDCVASVLKNSFNDYEIILVDDGSTDGVSGQLCDEIASGHPELIRVIHQENKGLGGARNTGIVNALGDYLLFLDSDDSITDDTLPLLAEKITSSGADIIAFNFNNVYPDGSKVPVSANYIQPSEAFKLSEHTEYLLSLPTACGRVWKKTLFTESGIEFPSKVWYEDIRTTTKLFALAGSILTIPDALYIYYQRNDSIMHTPNILRNREIIDAFDDILVWFKGNGMYEEYKDVLCQLAIDNVYVAASVRVLREDTKHPLLCEFSQYMDNNFPGYQNSPYIAKLPKMKKLAYKLLRGKHYKLLALLFKIKG